MINPMLHGQTMQQIWYACESGTHIKTDRPLVEMELARSLPELFAGLEGLRHNSSVLQRTGAQVFFRCMGIAMERCKIAGAGVPKHDGWIFSGTESQAMAVHRIFEAEAERITGAKFPVKLEAIC